LSNGPNANVGCLLVGEYMDEAASASNAVACSGEVVRPQLVASYVDLWATHDGMKDFTVLLRDNRIVTVRGHGPKYVQDTSNSEEAGSYAILAPSESGDITVAFFRVGEVTGIFCGNIRLSPQ
jgi:hypothetical protein